jgi:hypothetical protein
MRAVFDLLLRIQATSGLRFLLIGGWALQAYGYARQTVDVDCMTMLSVNRGKVSPAALQQLCDQFGPPESAQTLSSFL